MDVRTEDGPESELVTGQRMGKIGVELVMKAAICAAMIALIAGMVAVVVGS
ncbi:MAG: hypothetical protein HY651_01730 [Acidobacteria bacterium]|nr:hypothetical protein [Acidobacteriota bacterium]